MFDNVVIYQSLNPTVTEKMQAFIIGLQTHGVDYYVCTNNERIDADLAVTWGHRRNDVYKYQLEREKDYLVMELGYVGDRYDTFTSLGFNGLNGNARFPIDSMRPPSDERRMKHFPDALKPWRGPIGTNRVVLIGQVPGDQSIVGVSFEHWLSNQQAYWENMGYEVVYRDHPQSNVRHMPHLTNLNDLSIDEVLDQVDVVVTYNSNVGVLAGLKGVPVTSWGPSSMAWCVARRLDAQGMQYMVPTVDHREDWANRLAWKQWTTLEMAVGEAWEHLTSGSK